MVNIEELNKIQREAVLKTEGPVMVLAGAGSGKTKMLVSKISYLLDDMNISPFQILALTFSNKAAREMRERIARQVEEEHGALQITTFHAFCARVLRSEAEYIGLSRSFTIYDTSESKAIAKTILARRGISTKEVSPFEILYYIDELKNNGHYPGRSSDYFSPDTADSFYDYYQEYESELHKANAVDFGGLIVGVVQLFEKFPEVLEKYKNRFKYILVDEYQDTNRVQFELIKTLSEVKRNICVVGDEDQSIYSWRGADINNILNFEKYFPEVEVLKLEQNYRSSKMIIEAASFVISRNSMRKGKNMWTDNPEGDIIEIVESHSDRDEGDFISKEIQKISKNGGNYGDISVFYRTNSQSRLLEDSLRKQNIPYRIIGGVRFYERKEIKDLLAYLRLVTNEKDSLAFCRIINVPARGIGATTLRKLENEAIKVNSSLWEIVGQIVDNYENYSFLKLSNKVRSSLENFVGLINEVKTMDKNGSLPSSLYEKILHESGYWQYLKSSKDYESLARIENLQELSSAFLQYEESQESPSISGFLENITLDSTSEMDSLQNDQRGEVSLMTIHGAKGLEFEYVFLAGAEENIFPSFKSLESGEQALEEERRLFYVAMTRAMKKLYIVFAQGRLLFGQLKFNGPSRFINEIPEKYYSWNKRRSRDSRGEFSEENEYDDFNQDIEEYDRVYQVDSGQSTKKSKNKSQFEKGADVVHSLYGQGKVLSSDGLGQNEKVLIRFSDGVKKKFMVKFAPLTVIN